MTDLPLAQLLTELFTAIKLLSGYPVPDVYPEVHQLPRAQLEARVCASGCAIKAYYIKGEGVFIDETLDIEHDPRARSILLHELVHHLQGVTGKFDSFPECDAWYAGELEAYRIQNQYLHRGGWNIGYQMSGSMRNCRAEPKGN